MRQAMSSGAQREDLPVRLTRLTRLTRPARPAAALKAEVGDTLIVGTGGAAGTARIGEIIAVTGPDGSPPFRVRWLAGEYESLIRPGRGARVQKGH
jgi:hypothetical protein